MALVESTATNSIPSLKEPQVKVSEKDVLFGRGGATNNHIGNRKFRELVCKHQEEYLLAKVSHIDLNNTIHVWTH